MHFIGIFVCAAVCTFGLGSALAFRCPAVEDRYNLDDNITTSWRTGVSGELPVKHLNSTEVSLNSTESDESKTLPTDEDLGLSDADPNHPHTCDDGSPAMFTGLFYHCCVGAIDPDTEECKGHCIVGKIPQARHKRSVDSLKSFVHQVRDGLWAYFKFLYEIIFVFKAIQA